MPRFGVRGVAGRPLFAAEPAAHVAVEAKTAAGTWFERAGLRQAAHVVCELAGSDGDALWRAGEALDAGDGVVWSGDDRDGPVGGAACIRRVRDRAEAADALAALSDRCDRVRIMPFVEGVPCGINALVLPDGVAVARPMEMVVLRQGPRMRYYGCASYWEPDPADRQALEDAAVRVGRALHDHIGFRGAFTVDGVVGAQGFVPTEINTRTGGGLSTLEGLDEGPLPRPDRADADREPPRRGERRAAAARPPAPLRRTPHRLRARRRRSALAGRRRAPHRLGRRPLPARRRGRARPRLAVDPPHATARLPPLRPRRSAHTPTGPPIAPRVAAALALADELLGTTFGVLLPSGG